MLEQSVVAKGFIVTELVDPLTPDIKLAFTSNKNFWIGVGVLILMVLPCSAIAPMTVGLPAKHPLVKSTWRLQGNTIWSIPLVCLVYYFLEDQAKFKQDFSLPVMLECASGSLLGFAWSACLIVGCSMTLTAQAEVMYT